MGIFDYLFIMNIVTTIGFELYKQYKGDVSKPMTKEEYNAIYPTLQEMRKTAVKNAVGI